jgi:hypothetical protein
MANDVKAVLIQNYCRSRNYPEPAAEVVFHPIRKWRFDLAWDCVWRGEPVKVALEFQGGAWVGGRHTRGAGFQADCDKFSAAALAGWRVLPCTVQDVETGAVFALVDRLFGERDR